MRLFFKTKQSDEVICYYCENNTSTNKLYEKQCCNYCKDNYILNKLKQYTNINNLSASKQAEFYKKKKENVIALGGDVYRMVIYNKSTFIPAKPNDNLLFNELQYDYNHIINYGGYKFNEKVSFDTVNKVYTMIEKSVHLFTRFICQHHHIDENSHKEFIPCILYFISDKVHNLPEVLRYEKEDINRCIDEFINYVIAVESIEKIDCMPFFPELEKGINLLTSTKESVKEMLELQKERDDLI